MDSQEPPIPPANTVSSEKKPTTKQSKAQRRAQQAEFNRQLWAEALVSPPPESLCSHVNSRNREGPTQTNYFLSTRNVAPLKQEFKPPPVLLSRKGPPTIVQQRQKPIDAQLGSVNLDTKEESSEDEDELAAREKERVVRKEQAKRDREEKARKYEERRQELFGTTNSAGAAATGGMNGRPNSRSGNSSPNLTPPASRSATPNRGRGRGRGRGGLNQVQTQPQPHRNSQSRQQELFDPGYTPKPDSWRGSGEQGLKEDKGVQPDRQPKGPDGSGRGGFGFAARGGSLAQPQAVATTTASAIDEGVGSWT